MYICSILQSYVSPVPGGKFIDGVSFDITKDEPTSTHLHSSFAEKVFLDHGTANRVVEFLMFLKSINCNGTAELLQVSVAALPS